MIKLTKINKNIMNFNKHINNLSPIEEVDYSNNFTFFYKIEDILDNNKLKSDYLNNLKNRENNDIYIKVENYIKWWDILDLEIDNLNKINNNLIKILFYSELKKRYPKNDLENDLIIELNWDFLFSSFIKGYDKNISLKNQIIARWLYFEKWNEKFWNIIFNESSFENCPESLAFINLLWLFELDYTTEPNWNKKYKLSEEKFNILKNYFSTIQRANSLENISDLTLKEQNNYFWKIENIHNYLEPGDILKFILENGIFPEELKEGEKTKNIQETIKNTIVKYESITPYSLNQKGKAAKASFVSDKIMPLYNNNYSDETFLKYIETWLTEMVKNQKFTKFHFLSIWKSNISWFFEQKKHDNKTGKDYFYLWWLNSKTNLWLGFPLFKERVKKLWKKYDLVLEVALSVWDNNNESAEFLIKKYEELWFKVVWKPWTRKNDKDEVAYEYIEMKRNSTWYNKKNKLSEWGYSTEKINNELVEYSYLLEDSYIQDIRSLDIQKWEYQIREDIEIIEMILKAMNWNEEFKYDDSKTILGHNLDDLYHILEEYQRLIEMWHADRDDNADILYPKSDNEKKDE